MTTPDDVPGGVNPRPCEAFARACAVAAAGWDSTTGADHGPGGARIAPEAVSPPAEGGSTGLDVAAARCPPFWPRLEDLRPELQRRFDAALAGSAPDADRGPVIRRVMDEWSEWARGCPALEQDVAVDMLGVTQDGEAALLLRPLTPLGQALLARAGVAVRL